MKIKLPIELYWAIGTIFTTIIIGLIIFDKQLFNGRPLELQLHDTYFIFPKSLVLIAIFIFLMGSMYLNRAIYNHLDNRAIGTSTTLALCFILFWLTDYWNWVYGYVKDSGYYFFDERTQTEKISNYTMTHWALTIIIMMLIVTVVTTGYKTVRPKRVD